MSKKIVLIDDDPGIHLLAVPILSAAGYQVISAKNGEQGLQIALNEKPDLILLDVIMPGIKGRELCVKIKSYQVLRNIPVVFFTALDSDESIEAEKAVGSAGRVTKPVNAEELTAAIKAIIG